MNGPGIIMLNERNQTKKDNIMCDPIYRKFPVEANPHRQKVG
jgi:hypothetical protein